MTGWYRPGARNPWNGWRLDFDQYRKRERRARVKAARRANVRRQLQERAR